MMPAQPNLLQCFVYQPMPREKPRELVVVGTVPPAPKYLRVTNGNQPNTNRRPSPASIEGVIDDLVMTFPRNLRLTLYVAMLALKAKGYNAAIEYKEPEELPGRNVITGPGAAEP